MTDEKKARLDELTAKENRSEEEAVELETLEKEEVPAEDSGTPTEPAV